VRKGQIPCPAVTIHDLNQIAENPCILYKGGHIAFSNSYHFRLVIHEADDAGLSRRQNATVNDQIDTMPEYFSITMGSVMISPSSFFTLVLMIG